MCNSSFWYCNCCFAEEFVVGSSFCSVIAAFVATVNCCFAEEFVIGSSFCSVIAAFVATVNYPFQLNIICWWNLLLKFAVIKYNLIKERELGNKKQLIMYVGMDCTTPTPNPTQCIIYKRKRRNMTLNEFHIMFDIPKHGS